VTINVGDTVTWTNKDAAAHSAVVVVRGADESPELPAGATDNSSDTGRVAVWGGIGALLVYMVVRGGALLRRR
jgi:plastocyanin